MRHKTHMNLRLAGNGFVGISLFFFFVFSAFSVFAGKNDTSIVVVDYNNPVIDYLPIDRPVNFLVTGIPGNVKAIEFVIYRFDSRNGAKMKGGKVPNDKMAGLNITDTITCIGGGINKTVRSENFVLPKNFLPNNNYFFSIVPKGGEELSLDQKTEVKKALQAEFVADSKLRASINEIFQAYYNNPATSYKTLPKKILGDINQSIDRIVKEKLPTYSFNGKSDIDMSFIESKVDAARNLSYKAAGLAGTKNKDAKDLIVSFNNYDWVGLADDATAKAAVGALNIQEPTDAAITAKAADAMTALNSLSTAVPGLINAVIEKVAIPNISSFAVNSSYYLDVTQNAKTNLTFDIAGAYSYSMDQLFAYSAINIYFRPIDKHLPLRNMDATCKDFWGSRFSLLGGITLTPVDKQNVRKGVVGNKGVVAGASFRFLSWFKINGGTLIYNGADKNPLVSSYSTRFTPFVSASIDIDIKPLFSSIPLFNDLLFK